MFYDKITVNIPNKKRITHTKNKEYVYEIIYRKGKDHKKEKSICVGIKVSDDKMQPNDKYYDLHKEHMSNKPLSQPKTFDFEVKVGAPMLLRNIAAHNGMEKMLQKHFEGRAELIQTLIEYCMIEKESACQLFKHYLFDNYTLLNCVPSETTLSNFFNKEITHEKIQNFLNDWLRYHITNLSGCKDIYINFDSTNKNVSSKNVDSAERGIAKVNEGLPQINIAYFLDSQTGIPLYFDVYYGSIVDMEHCKTAVNILKNIDEKTKTCFVMDRGYFSGQNLDFLSENNYKFICMAKDCKAFDQLIVQNPHDKISDPENRVIGTIFGIKTQGKITSTSKLYHLYLFYNDENVPFMCKEKQDYVEIVCKQLIGKRDQKHAIRNTYDKMINFKMDEKNWIVDAKPNYEYLRQSRKTSGYFLIVSSEDLSCSEILQAYRFRNNVEVDFKYSKSGMDLNKTFARSDKVFEAKTFISFLGSILRSEICLQCKSFLFEHTDETTQTILKELNKIKATKINDKYLMRYALTSKQKQILSCFLLGKDDVIQAINNINISRQNLD